MGNPSVNWFWMYPLRAGEALRVWKTDKEAIVDCYAIRVEESLTGDVRLGGIFEGLPRNPNGTFVNPSEAQRMITAIVPQTTHTTVNPQWVGEDAAFLREAPEEMLRNHARSLLRIELKVRTPQDKTKSRCMRRCGSIFCVRCTLRVLGRHLCLRFAIEEDRERLHAHREHR